MRLVNSFEPVSLDQLGDLAKAGLHIGRQRFEFISNSIVEQFYDPSHQPTSSHFCNVAGEGSVTRRLQNGSIRASGLT